jgi:NAD(P)-dependent dehydrogenase (short-subunit alcohol dehydrogenase family)
MTMDFAGQVAVVAGGTGGLGRAISAAFMEAGAAVVVTYHGQAEFDAVAATLEAKSTTGAKLEGVHVDVTDESALRSFVDEVFARHGRLDALVNAVGGYTGGSTLWETEGSALDRMLALNLRSGYALARAVMPRLIAQGRGSFVNIAAKAGLEHPAGAAAYAASKAAALALMDVLAADSAGTGVRVNSVLPSIIDTEANRRAMPKANFAKWPKPEDIARVVRFLCGDEARVIHGASIPVYGSQ